jgi:ABC-2 type transport system permease protein
MNATYVRIELLRVIRSPRFLIFTLVMPLVLYILLSAAYGTDTIGGAAPLAWFMVSMSVFGAMGGATSVSARIAVERAAGWTRQLRLTPLSGRAYLVAKAATALLVAIPSLLLLYAAGHFVKHVDLPAGTWAEMFGWTVLGLIPFVALGLLLGHVFGNDILGPLSGALYTVLALLGGIWFPVSQMPTAVADLAKALPSYWLAQAGRAPLTGDTIGARGLAVLAAWTVLFGALAIARYRRDTARV